MSVCINPTPHPSIGLIELAKWIHISGQENPINETVFNLERGIEIAQEISNRVPHLTIFPRDNGANVEPVLKKFFSDLHRDLATETTSECIAPLIFVDQAAPYKLTEQLIHSLNVYKESRLFSYLGKIMVDELFLSGAFFIYSCQDAIQGSETNATPFDIKNRVQLYRCRGFHLTASLINMSSGEDLETKLKGIRDDCNRMYTAIQNTRESLLNSPYSYKFSNLDPLKTTLAEWIEKIGMGNLAALLFTHYLVYLYPSSDNNDKNSYLAQRDNLLARRHKIEFEKSSLRSIKAVRAALPHGFPVEREISTRITAYQEDRRRAIDFVCALPDTHPLRKSIDAVAHMLLEYQRLHFQHHILKASIFNTMGGITSQLKTISDDLSTDSEPADEDLMTTQVLYSLAATRTPFPDAATYYNSERVQISQQLTIQDPKDLYRKAFPKLNPYEVILLHQNFRTPYTSQTGPLIDSLAVDSLAVRLRRDRAMRREYFGKE